jgi:hypothetical protein
LRGSEGPRIGERREGGKSRPIIKSRVLWIQSIPNGLKCEWRVRPRASCPRPASLTPPLHHSNIPTFQHFLAPPQPTNGQRANRNTELTGPPAGAGDHPCQHHWPAPRHHFGRLGGQLSDANRAVHHTGTIANTTSKTSFNAIGADRCPSIHPSIHRMGRSCQSPRALPMVHGQTQQETVRC